MRRWAGTIGAVVLLVLIMAASSVQGTARFELRDVGWGTAEPPPPPTMPPMTPGPAAQRPANDGSDAAGTVVMIILLVLAAAIIAVVAFFVVRAIVRALRARVPVARPASPGAASLEAEPDLEKAAPAIRQGIRTAADRMDDHPEPSDAIVAAWVGLEASAADAGTTRGLSETPAEFTVRVIAHRQQISREVRTLLGLYERVRFAGRAATDADRVTARLALVAIEEGWR